MFSLMYNICKTPIPQAAKSCLSQLNKLSLKQPLLGWFALGLASLATSRQGLFCYPMKERRQKMPKGTALPYSERKKRDEMFLTGMLWCAGHKQFEPVKDFNKYKSITKQQTNYGYRFYCNTYRKEVQQPARAEKHKEFFRNRNIALKREWVELAGGKCQRCGYSEFVSALEFHHVYPALKKYTPSTLIFCNNKPKIWKELDKCCLLCSICHRTHKAREWQAEFVKRDGFLGWTVGDPLPLDDTRYEVEKPPTYKQTPLPLFTYQQRDLQLRLFEQQVSYIT